MIFIFLLIAGKLIPLVKEAGGEISNMSNVSEFIDIDIFGGAEKSEGVICQNVDLGGAAVKLFQNEGCNSKDPGFVITLNNNVDNLKNYNGNNYNDKITSLVVADGYKVTLYEDKNYGGDYITFYGPTIVSNLKEHERSGTHKCGSLNLARCHNNWNDAVSSIKIKRYTEEPLVILYRASDFTGSNREITDVSLVGQCINLDDLGFDNVLSSIKIKDGYAVSIYGSKDCDLYGAGQSLIVSSESKLSDNDWASSLKVVRKQ